MCKLKSAIVLKDRIYLADNDSHDKMLEELGIKDIDRNAETKFVRVELVPKNGDPFTPVDEWILNVDQDIRPDWFFKELEKPKIIESVKEWAKDHIFDGVNNLMLKTVGTYYLRNCKGAILQGNITATLWDNSTATLWDNSTATLWDNSTATLRDNSTGRIPDDYYGGKRESYVLMDNSTLKDCKTNTIYQAGKWKYVEVEQNV